MKKRSGFLAFLFNSAPMRKKEAEFSDQAYRLHIKGMDAGTAKTAEKYLSEYKRAYSNAQSQTRLKDVHIYDEDIADLQEWHDTLVREEWEKKADKILDRFLVVYYSMKEPLFSEVDKAYRSKNKCIKLWEDYFSSVPKGIYVNTSDYLKQFCCDDFDDCMLSKDALAQTLDGYVRKMEPEYKRKMSLRKEIVALVHPGESALRHKLLQSQFHDATEKEALCCYNELVRRHVLVETKVGSRYYVSLPEKLKKDT